MTDETLGIINNENYILIDTSSTDIPRIDIGKKYIPNNLVPVISALTSVITDFILNSKANTKEDLEKCTNAFFDIMKNGVQLAINNKFKNYAENGLS